MRLSSLSAALFAALAWTTNAAEEGEIKSVSVRFAPWEQKDYCVNVQIANIGAAADAHSCPGWWPFFTSDHGTRYTSRTILTNCYVALPGL